MSALALPREVRWYNAPGNSSRSGRAMRWNNVRRATRMTRGECVNSRPDPSFGLGQALQAAFFSALQDPDARQVRLVHDAVHLQALVRVEQPPEVVEDLRGDELAGHEHRDAGRIGHDLVGADPAGELVVDALALVDHRPQLAAAVIGVARQAAQPRA